MPNLDQSSNSKRGRKPFPDEAKLLEILLIRAHDPSLKRMSAAKRCVKPENSNTWRRLADKYRPFEEWEKYNEFGLTNLDVVRLYIVAERYGPDTHLDAPIGTLARVSEKTPLCTDAVSKGWNPWRPPHPWWRQLGDEWLFRRDHLQGFRTLEELIKECAEDLAQIGTIEIDCSPQDDDEPSFGPW